MNALTSRGIDFARIPCVLESDREAVRLALRACVGGDPARPRIIRIADSLHTETMWISEAMEGAATARLEIQSGPMTGPLTGTVICGSRQYSNIG